MYQEVKDKDFDYKSVVINGYNQCAEKYQEARRQEHEPSLDFIFTNVAENSSILDAGCGSGIPVCKLLSKKYQVTGIDISGRQIELARKNVPQAQFINSDILDYKQPINSLDAVISYYSLFHIPRQIQPRVLSQFYAWLKPGGYLVITLAVKNENAYTEDDFFDVLMYWSHYGIKEYRAILTDIGFTLLEQDELGHGYRDPENKAEHHALVIAAKE